jgi:O-antigen ligase
MARLSPMRTSPRLTSTRSVVQPPTPAPASAPAPTKPLSRIEQITNAARDFEKANPVRILGSSFALMYLFFRFSGIHELMAITIGTTGYLLYLTGIPAAFCLLLSGGLKRSLESRAAKYWMGYPLWLLLAVPFSSWTRSSATIVLTYIRTDFILLFMVGGLLLTWKDCRRLMNVLGCAAIVAIFTGYYRQGHLGTGRMELTGGITIGDPNDYAALLLLLMPFLISWVIIPGKPLALRILTCLITVYGLYLVLSTGSRGAMLGIAAVGILIMTAITFSQRLLIGVVTLVVGLGLVAVLPSQIVERLSSAFSGTAVLNSGKEGEASAQARLYVLQRSVQFTFQYPLFGVGVGEFADSEGTVARSEGQQGSWHDTHNTYTQASSESGVPALLFMLLGLGSSFLLVLKTNRIARRLPNTPENRQIRNGTVRADEHVGVPCGNLLPVHGLPVLSSGHQRYRHGVPSRRDGTMEGERFRHGLNWPAVAARTKFTWNDLFGEVHSAIPAA